MKIDIDWTVPEWFVMLALGLVTVYSLVAMASAVLTFIEIWQRRQEYRATVRSTDAEGSDG